MKHSYKRISPGLRIFLAVLAAAMLWVCAGHFLTAQAKSRSKNEIIREILYAYYWDQDLSAKRTQNLLKELEEADSDAADRWRSILDCWTKATTNMPVNYGSVPDDLENGNQLCLIALGYQLNDDGSMQKELVSRLETVLESAKKYPDCYILCTGGGTAAAAPEITEADAMAQWLEEKGIDKKRIIVENQSLSTSQNAMLSYQLLKEQYPQISQAAIITSDYHLPWGMILFQTQFILGEHPIAVVSSAACHADDILSPKILLTSQISGIMEIAGIS